MSENIRLSSQIPFYEVGGQREEEIRTYLTERLYKEASYRITELLKSGNRLGVHSLGINEIKGVYGDPTLELEVEVYHVRDSTHYDLMGKKMLELLERDAYVRVHYGYAWSHLHPNPLPSIASFDAKDMHTQLAHRHHQELVILEPVYNDRGRELGRIGKCDGCGKVFYCVKE